MISLQDKNNLVFEITNVSDTSFVPRIIKMTLEYLVVSSENVNILECCSVFNIKEYHQMYKIYCGCRDWLWASLFKAVKASQFYTPDPQTYCSNKYFSKKTKTKKLISATSHSCYPLMLCYSICFNIKWVIIIVELWYVIILSFCTTFFLWI